MVCETRTCQVPVTTCRMVAETVRQAGLPRRSARWSPSRASRCVPRPSARCRRSSASARCRTPSASQVAEPKTICCPVTVQQQVTEMQERLRAQDGLQAGARSRSASRSRWSSTARPAVMPSSQSVVASAQSSCPSRTVPPCDPCDAKHPLFGRLGGHITEPRPASPTP